MEAAVEAAEPELEEEVIDATEGSLVSALPAASVEAAAEQGESLR